MVQGDGGWRGYRSFQSDRAGLCVGTHVGHWICVPGLLDVPQGREIEIESEHEYTKFYAEIHGSSCYVRPIWVVWILNLS